MLSFRNLRPQAPRLAIAGAALVVAATQGAAAALAEDCFADWGAAGAIVRAQKLMTVSELSKLAGAEVAGAILKTTLCKDGDDYIYKLVVRDAKGQLKTVVVDARAKGKAATDQ